MASSYTGYSSEVISPITRPPVRRRKSRTSAWVASAVRLPTTRLTTSRLSGSSAVWSQQSPRRGSSGSQFFSFRPTNDHFSSNWTSLVAGGKSHEFVVESLGMGAGQADVSGDRIRVDPGQPGRLSGADPLGHMGEDGGGLVRRQPGIEQGGALALGEP